MALSPFFALFASHAIVVAIQVTRISGITASDGRCPSSPRGRAVGKKRFAAGQALRPVGGCTRSRRRAVATPSSVLAIIVTAVRC